MSHPATPHYALSRLVASLVAGGLALALTSDGLSYSPADAVTVSVDPNAVGHEISPLIYGTSMADGATVHTLGATVDRWGGNQTSLYNWANGQAWNAGRDWGFRNVNYSKGQAGSAADRFVAGALDNGASPLVTIPTIGWVARNGDNATASVSVPAQGGPPITAGSDAIAGYDPAANRLRVAVASQPTKPGPFVDAPAPGPVVYQDEWVAHLLRRFGGTRGGVHLFAMDNEPDLWSVTHTDVHPTRMGYDDMLSTFEAYASAVKRVDPSAQVLGPDVWGWTSYFFSDLDRGTDRYRTHADRLAHGDEPFLPWWLDRLARYQEEHGVRLLDYLDVHYYPQAPGVYSPRHDPATQALRVRSTRALYDSGYGDESWIGEPVRLIPRLKEWIAAHYPGTKLAITEYSWGGQRDASGAVALAEVLGIFGREGVDLATYFPYPPPNSPAAAAFRLYRNIDGHGAAAGDISLPARVSGAGIAAFATRHSASGELDVLLINEGQKRRTVRLDLGGEIAYQVDQFWLPAGSARIESGRSISLTKPFELGPLSMVLVRLRPAG